jgi:hypothetical protein
MPYVSRIALKRLRICVYANPSKENKISQYWTSLTRTHVGTRGHEPT